jgi:uncharacterized protein YjiS (DUF1127 family)
LPSTPAGEAPSYTIAAWIGHPDPAASGAQGLVLHLRETPFSLRPRIRVDFLLFIKYQGNRLCNSATLRRSIFAFPGAELPYFRSRSIPAAGRTRNEKGTAMLAAIVRFFRERSRYSQSVSELRRLGDRELADIGISRSDIPRVAWDAVHQD